MKYVAVVVLYNPTKEDICRVLEYRKAFDYVYIYDNTIDNRSYREIFENDIDKLIYLYNGTNDGLSTAYNVAIDLACNIDADYLCTLDQDSVYKYDDINNMKKFIMEYQLTDVAIYAPLVDYCKSGIQRNKIYEFKDWVISSGSFIDLRIIKQGNIRFDEKYFIDRVDVDFCKQVRINLYKILVYNNSILQQTLGDGNGEMRNNHSILRHYYIYRNRFYYNSKYIHGLKKYLANGIQTVKHILRIIAFEKNKFKKIQVLKYAYTDYVKGKMGSRHEGF